MSRLEWKEILASPRGKSLLVDSNLLLLYFAGRANLELIRILKPLRSHRFTVTDFTQLGRLVHHFQSRLITTPHVLTEVSNLSNTLHGHVRTAFFVSFARQLDELTEQHVDAKRLSDDSSFSRFGLTDTAILKAAGGSIFVLTIDRELVGQLQKREIPALNFLDLRILWSGA